MVDVALFDVSVQTAVHHHGALNVYFVANFEQTEVGTLQGFVHGGYDVAVAVDLDHGEAYAVVGNALVNFEFMAKIAFQGEVFVVFNLLNGNYARH